MNETIYIRMKRKVSISSACKLKIKDITYMIAPEPLKSRMMEAVIYEVTKEDKEYAVIDNYTLIDCLKKLSPQNEFENIGCTETIIHIRHEHQNWIPLKVGLAWLILFIGTAMTIMNFHYDVNMLEVQQKLHYLFTGEDVKHPLWIQIPYSIGLGIGMILFLNHWFKKRFNEEPSPLELELFTYQQGMNQYVAYYENELNDENSSL